MTPTRQTTGDRVGKPREDLGHRRDEEFAHHAPAGGGRRRGTAAHPRWGGRAAEL